MKVKDVDIKTITGCSEFGSFDIEVGTNGYHGGDGCHGGRTYIKITHNGGPANDFSFRSFNEHGFEIFLSGDLELDEIISTFDFAAGTLEDMRLEKLKEVAKFE